MTKWPTSVELLGSSLITLTQYTVESSVPFRVRLGERILGKAGLSIPGTLSFLGANLRRIEPLESRQRAPRAVVLLRPLLLLF